MTEMVTAVSPNPASSIPCVLRVGGLHVSFETEIGSVLAVRGIDLDVGPGEILAVVGESGSGKTSVFSAILGLLDPSVTTVTAECIEIMDPKTGASAGKASSPKNLVGYIQQDAQASLDPVFTIGYQISETLVVRDGLSWSEARRRSVELLDLVGIPDAALRVKQYPHQFSGGMCQRVAIAIAIAANPVLLVADEPTTALDVTVQAQILKLIQRLRDERRMSVVLITHDLGVVAELADSVVVMYAGSIVEKGPVADVFSNPRHPYTLGLMRAIPGGRSRTAEGRLYQLPGRSISAGEVSAGCAFAERCSIAQSDCQERSPSLMPVGPSHLAACFHSAEVWQLHD